MEISPGGHVTQFARSIRIICMANAPAEWASPLHCSLRAQRLGLLEACH